MFTVSNWLSGTVRGLGSEVVGLEIFSRGYNLGAEPRRRKIYFHGHKETLIGRVWADILEYKQHLQNEEEKARPF